jgi:hypothetical protein
MLRVQQLGTSRETFSSRAEPELQRSILSPVQRHRATGESRLYFASASAQMCDPRP